MRTAIERSEHLSSALLNMRWKVRNELYRRLVYPYARMVFAANRISWGKNWRLYGIPIIQKHRRSVIRFGDGLQLRSTVRSNPLGPNHPVMVASWQEDATILVGSDFGMTGGTLCATCRINIGDRVAVGANTIICDTDFHPLNAAIRQMHPSGGKSAEIIIEDDVFIGMNSIILKGVLIGQGSVIGAGSVVAASLPGNVIAAGNPARVISNL
jgi:acetyltransferase-like isoleucine patch superfamily enzyme